MSSKRTLLAILLLAPAAGTTALAATVSHAAKAVPAAVSDTASLQSSMPYRCDKAEVATRIEKRSCR